MPTILIADDNAMVRRCVRETLEDQEGWIVCGEAAGGREAIEMTAELRPDIVVLDLSMPEVNGLQAAQEIHKRFPGTEILMLTMHDAPELMEAAFACGARAFVVKHDLGVLIDTVREILEEKLVKAATVIV